MKYIQVPLAGGEIQIDPRTHTVDLVLAVEDGSRTLRMTLFGVNADLTVEKVVGCLSAVQQNVLEAFTEWIGED